MSVTYHIQRLKKKKNHVSISTDKEKAFDKIKYPFTIKKILSKFRIRAEFLQLDREHLLKIRHTEE